MVKGFAAAALVVALAASTTSAFPGDFQQFGLSLDNGVLQIGDGAASSTNWGLVLEAQERTDDIRHTTAFQGFNGAITQTAGASGLGIIAAVCQDGALAGRQYQNPRTGEQWQHLGTDLDQSLVNAGGSGSALGVQTALGIGTQLIFTPYGATANVQAIGDVVYDGTAGGPGGTIHIDGGTAIGLGQTSMPG
jgi:hypothetical protein